MNCQTSEFAQSDRNVYNTDHCKLFVLRVYRFCFINSHYDEMKRYSLKVIYVSTKPGFLFSYLFRYNLLSVIICNTFTFVSIL